MRGGNAKEIAKLGVRLALHRTGVSIGRDPFVNRVARLLEARDIETVLDVGANVGQFARMVRGAGFDGDILSFEPLSDAYRRLTRRSKGDPRWRAFNTAVGAEPGRSTIHISANSYSSSLLAMTKAHLDAAPGSEFIGTEDVDVTTVASIVDEHGLDPARMFIKVDTQGFEKSVMAGAGAVIDDGRGRPARALLRRALRGTGAVRRGRRDHARSRSRAVDPRSGHLRRRGPPAPVRRSVRPPYQLTWIGRPSS